MMDTSANGEQLHKSDVRRGGADRVMRRRTVGLLPRPVSARGQGAPIKACHA